MRRLNKEVQKVVQFAQRDRLNIDDFTEGVIVTVRPPKKQSRRNILVLYLTMEKFCVTWKVS